jgi:hypothetical protein
MRTLAAAALALTTLLAACGTGRESPPPDVSGEWSGILEVSGISLDISVAFTVGDTLSGTIDIPMQMAFDLELDNEYFAGDSIHFELPSNLGRASFDGLAEPDSICGTFLQSGVQGVFRLGRPGPDRDLPYLEEEVEIPVQGWTYMGTLSIPEGEGPFPAVVMLTGSGMQDRDENVFGFEVFASLADSLTRSGMAVLRCDDRGFRAETPPTVIPSESLLAADAASMLLFMEGRAEIDAGMLGLLGHSEGSSIALRAAADTGAPARPDFVVCMAGPAVSGYDLLLVQVVEQARLSGFTEEQAASQRDAQRRIMDLVLSGGGDEEIGTIVAEQVRAVIALMPPEQVAMLGDTAAYVAESVEQSLEMIRSGWFRSFLTEDPSSYAASAGVPILALYGSLDSQVPAQQSAGPMEAALAGSERSRVIVFEGANHLFQPAVTGGVDEYAFLAREFVPGFSDAIAGWISGLDEPVPR